MIYRYLFVVWLLQIGIGPALAQQLTPAQQAELDKAAREAKAEFEKVTDPAYMSRLFDEQIRDARKNGASPELIRELEQAKKDALKQLRELKTNPNPQPAPKPADNTASDKAETDLIASLKGRLARPDTIVPVIYDEQPSRYSDIPGAFRVYTEAKLTPEGFVAFMQKKYGVTLREKGRFGTRQAPLIQYVQLHESYALRLARYSTSLDSNGYVTRASGTLFTVSSAAVGLTSPQALLPALRQATKQSALPLLSEPLPTARPQRYAVAEPPLWIPPNLTPGPPMVLTQPFTVRTPTDVIRWYLDARTGQVVASESQLINCHPPLPKRPVRRIANTFHSGRRGLGVSPMRYGDKPGFFLADSSDTPVVVVLSPTLKTVPQHTIDTTLNDAALRVRGDFDALYGLRQAANYFKALGMNSFDGAGTTVRASAYNVVNACFDPSEKQFFFGMYQGKPLLTLMTAGHEFTHGVSKHFIDFVYQGESGAIHESIGDIFGRAIEQQNLGGNWVILEEVEAGGLRNMANPKALKHADTYGEQYWVDPGNISNDKGGVHDNAGIGNRWFYLLVNGGKGQNDLKHPYDVSQTLPMQQVTRLLLATLPKLSPISGYDDLCRETIATAESQYGECSKQTEAVKQAWYAVGVLDDPPVPCKPGWSMDMVMKGDGKRQVIKLYFKGDSSVSVTRTPDAIVKTFTRRSSPFISTVFQDQDGLHTALMPKNISDYTRNMIDNVMPAQEAILKQGIKEARAELRNPDTSPERRADIQRGLSIAERQLQHLKEGAAEAKAMQQDLEAGGIPKTDLQFWETRKARRQFDKDHIKATQLYENRYLAKKYEVGGGMYWWTTAQIPLRMSDLLQASVMMPVAQMQNGLDHWLRGFPIQYHEMFRIQNISEAAPANFDTLFSMAPVFD